MKNLSLTQKDLVGIEVWAMLHCARWSRHTVCGGLYLPPESVIHSLPGASTQTQKSFLMREHFKNSTG